MKKIFSLLLTFTILSSAIAIPAFADNNRMNNNGVRATAATDDNDTDWSWLGLLGLAGLFGLRSRDRERT